MKIKFLENYMEWVQNNPKKAIGYSILVATVLIIVVAVLA